MPSESGTNIDSYTSRSESMVVEANERSKLFVSDDEDSAPEQDKDEEELFNSQVTAIVGDISSTQLKKLFNRFKSKPLLEAVNYYFDHTEEFQLASLNEQETNMDSKRKRQREGNNDNDNDNGNDDLAEIRKLDKQLENATKKRDLEDKLQEKKYVKDKKYIGTLNVDSWCTRSVFRSFDYGKKMNLFVTENFVKLLDPENGDREVAKIPTEIARYLAPVLQLKICFCEVRVIYNDKKLRMGDSFLVQVDIFINPKFIETPSKDSVILPSSRGKSATNKLGSENVESQEEKVQRLKRTCLSTLFEFLSLKPISGFLENNEDGQKGGDQEEDVVVLDSDEEEMAQEVSAVIETGAGDDASEWDELQKTRKEDGEADNNQDGALNLNQLKQIYKSTQMNFSSSVQDLSLTDPKDFKVTLRDYQKMGLTWLLRREQEFGLSKDGEEAEKKQNSIEVMNPLWKEYRWPNDKSWEAKGNPVDIDSTTTEEVDCFYFNHYSGQLSVEKPLIQSSCVGGILADEMGLGKTISTYSLINTCSSDQNFDPRDSVKERYAYKTTLIVVPMSLLYQWEKEYEKVNSNPENKLLVYYGAGGYLGQDILRMSPTVVLTTYGTIQSELAKGADIGLFSIKFFRVVLDEAHNIRNRATKTAKSCSELKSNRRWALTGTPIVNRLDDVFALVRYLKLSPWDNYNIWNTFVTKPFEEKQLSKSLETMEAILSPIILRRTKNQKDKEGNALVELPRKDVLIQKLKFNDKEKAVYDFFKNRATSSLRQKKNILANYSNILTHILRLRQVCCHLDLIYSTESDEDTNTLERRLAIVKNQEEDPITDEEEQSVLKLLKEDSGNTSEDEVIAAKEQVYARYTLEELQNIECAICTQNPIALPNMVIASECQHCYCASCLIDLFNFQKDKEILCPLCRVPIDKHALLKPELSDMERGYKVSLYRPYDKSSKINALLKSLNDIGKQESVVVFSPFSTFLDLIETELARYPKKFSTLKFDGRLRMDERQKILTEFTNPPPPEVDNRVRVLLLSLKAGGVGLNLTVASRAYLLSPWWAPSVENQAIDRIHRIGQMKDVTVIRFIMENSIEEKMLKVQDRKKHLGEVVESNDEEKRKRRIEEIMMLLEE